jgi:hypothetical protein
VQVQEELISGSPLQQRGALRFFPVLAHLLHSPQLRVAAASERLIADLAIFVGCICSAQDEAFSSGPGADFKACPA